MDGDRFRRVLGHFCTGVTVVAAVDAGEPVGFACQAFAALSLDPPLVVFCPSRTSGTWRRIESAGSFCVNVLAEDQRDMSRVFGRTGVDKFAGVDWKPAPSGAPALAGAVTWIDCTVLDVHLAGDHHLVIGEVLELGPASEARPLLFHKGRYTTTAAVKYGRPG